MFGFDFDQAFGSYEYNRSFFRLDSGKLPGIDTGISGSYSLTNANKWKGPGDLGPRNNINVMLKQPVGDKDQVKIWFNYNDVSQNLYMPLTYSQAQNLNTNYNKDYNGSLTGKASQDINYYDYNRGTYLNKDILSIIPVTINDTLKLSFKPYYSIENTEILGGSTSQGGLITRRTRDIDRYGVISQREYVSVINSSDDNRAGNPSYYVGAPFTTVLALSMEF